jgi:hypothetical protein
MAAKYLETAAIPTLVGPDPVLSTQLDKIETLVQHIDAHEKTVHAALVSLEAEVNRIEQILGVDLTKLASKLDGIAQLDKQIMDKLISFAEGAEEEAEEDEDKKGAADDEAEEDEAEEDEEAEAY